MENIITEVTEYCAKAGISLSTIGNLVSQNSRLVERLERRHSIIASDTAKLRAYMAAHPIEDR